jgi:hypothetical protein
MEATAILMPGQLFQFLPMVNPCLEGLTIRIVSMAPRSTGGGRGEASEVHS